MFLRVGDSGKDPLSRFYTADAISTCLVDLMRDEAPSRLLDLGAGQGALSKAARQRWSKTKILSVDIDAQAAARIRSLSSLKNGGGHQHFVADALSEKLPALLRHESVPSAVCNPPYANVAWKSWFGRLLEEARLDGAIAERSEAASDALFIAQNLRILLDGGQLGLIVPDGLMTGQRSVKFRRALLANHRVEYVVQLERGVFRRTDAQAFILVLRKGQRTGRTLLMRLSTNGHLSQAIAITREQAEYRLDYAYYQSVGKASRPSLEEYGASVIRGSLRAADIKSESDRIWAFHTTDFSRAKNGLVRFPKQSRSMFKPTVTWAEPGDILIARVDRSLHKKVCLVKSGTAPISECVLRVRIPVRWQLPVLEALTSPGGQDALLRISRGVAARMIAKADLLAMPLDIEHDDCIHSGG